MDQKPLLDVLAELTSKIRLLARERNEALARARALECEVTELGSLISLARAKMEEILKAGANDEISHPPAVDLPAESDDLERLDEFSPDPRRRLKRPFPGASSPG